MFISICILHSEYILSKIYSTPFHYDVRDISESRNVEHYDFRWKEI